MIAATLRWLRRFSPPGWVIGSALVVYALLEGIYVWMLWLDSSWGIEPRVAPRFLFNRDAVIAFAAGIYGVLRVLTVHPLLDADYRQWLSLTPWSYRNPLPLGPVNLAGQDAVAMALLMLLMHDSPLAVRLLAPAIFLTGYLAAVCLTLFLTKTWGEAYALLFGLGLAVRFLPWRWEASLAVLVVCYAAAWLGLRRSLMRFPWVEQTVHLGKTFTGRTEPRTPKQVGWPFDQLNPQPMHTRKSAWHGVAASILLGWWFYALQSPLPPDDLDARDAIAFFGVALCVALIGGRLINYCGKYWPPISLWGRLWTGRWIIPGYDRVLVAPLLGAAAALIALPSLLGAGAPYGAAYAATVTLVALACLAMGPDLENWRLTGAHRLKPPMSAGQEFEQLGR